MEKQELTVAEESTGLKLVAAERTLIAESPAVIDSALVERIQQTPANQGVLLTFDDLEDLHGYLASDANHTEDRRRQRALDKMLKRIERLLYACEQSKPDELASSPPSRATPAADQPLSLDEVPADFREIFLEVTALTDDFCRQRLNAECQAICRDAATSLCQADSPVVRGKRAGWAAGVVYAVGRVNFLGDPNREPYVRSEEISKWFGVSTATMHSKAKIISEGLDLFPFRPDYSLSTLIDQNPLFWMMEINGVLLDIREAPRAVQEFAFEQGVIPYIPADAAPRDDAYEVKLHHVSSTDATEPVAPAARPQSGVAYQIKITLDGFKPTIWRRLRVPDCTLDVLHEWIQAAMGWHGGHLHEFSVGKQQRFVMEEADEFDDVGPDARPESSVTLGELAAAGHKKLKYWYDFGDDWWHTVTIEKTLAPPADGSLACLAGAGACPPEDVGGVWGYAEFLEAVADPRHERHHELVEWCGGPFDPNCFDPADVTRALRS